MCVRYTLHQGKSAIDVIAEQIARELATPADIAPRYNVTLTHTMPVVAIKSREPVLASMMWGLVPPSSHPTLSQRMLPNAKAETARTLGPFMNATARRRCLIPANGFYEWETRGKSKWPHLFTLKDEMPFAFAGIWEPGDGDTPDSYAILTTKPNALVASIHQRMPVILTGKLMAQWLGHEPLAESNYHQITQPIAAQEMQSRPVNRYVNNSRHEGPECLTAPDEEPRELVLY